MSKVLKSLYLIIIFIPLSLGVVGAVVGKQIDINLYGYTDEAKTFPVLTFDTYLSGKFQNDCANWTNSHVSGRGVMVRTYNTIRYHAFDLGRYIVGKNSFLYQDPYIEETLSLFDYDYSVAWRQELLKAYVAELEMLNKRLEAVGKKLLVYTVPGKSTLFPENIPDKFYAVKSSTSQRLSDLFYDYLAETSVRCLRCSQFVESVPFPSYYATGIHWSRPYEQYCSQAIIEELIRITGKPYKRLLLGNVQKSRFPYNQDADVFNLLNIWDKCSGTFYQYDALIDQSDGRENVNMLLFGDSFSQGLRDDILYVYPDAPIHYIRRNEFYENAKGKRVPLDAEWGNIDFQTFLDESDVVVIGVAEIDIELVARGFVKALNNFLETYTPGLAGTDKQFMKALDINDSQDWSQAEFYGLWNREADYVWTKQNVVLYLNDKDIYTHGLRLRFDVPEEVFMAYSETGVAISVNGKLVHNGIYNQAQEEEIEIHDLDIPVSADGIVRIEINLSHVFIPSHLGMSNDFRALGLRLYYAGAIR